MISMFLKSNFLSNIFSHMIGRTARRLLSYTCYGRIEVQLNQQKNNLVDWSWNKFAKWWKWDKGSQKLKFNQFISDVHSQTSFFFFNYTFTVLFFWILSFWSLNLKLFILVHKFWVLKVFISFKSIILTVIKHN